MSMLVADCPRCDAKSITFDVSASVHRYQEYDWKDFYEVFSVCRNCLKPTIFLISLNEYEHKSVFRTPGNLEKASIALNQFFQVERFIGLRESNFERAPDYIPKDIGSAFEEAAVCLKVACYNASAAMFRLCIDLATRPMLPSYGGQSLAQPNGKQRRDLGLRLVWLFEQGSLPIGLRDLAKCIREDGNDGAHQGNLTKEDAEDILDFTRLLLERLYTEPERLRLAATRRDKRRES